MAGLFDYEDPNAVGNMAFAAGLLNAAGPSRMPVSVGQALSQGLMGRQAMASQAAAQQRRNQLTEVEVQRQRMLMQELMRQQAEQEQARQFMRQAYQTPGTQAASLPGGPTQANAAMIPQMPGGFNAGLMRNQALQAGNPTAVQLAESLEKARNIQKLGKDDRLVDLTGAPRTIVDAAPGDQWEDIGQNSRGQALQRNKRTGELKAIGQGPLVSVNTGNHPENPFLRAYATKQAEAYDAASREALAAQKGNNALTRIEGIVNAGGVTGGPLASVEVVGRNLAAQIGVPVDKVLDRNNAAYTAETATRLAEMIITGGRSLTDSDVARLENAWPGFRSGIPTAQLPAFIKQLKTINNERIAYFNELDASVDPKLKAQMPMTLRNPQPTAERVAQPNPPTIPVQPMKSLDEIMAELLAGQR